jgi:hypothetical protein
LPATRADDLSGEVDQRAANALGVGRHRDDGCGHIPLEALKEEAGEQHRVVIRRSRAEALERQGLARKLFQRPEDELVGSPLVIQFDDLLRLNPIAETGGLKQALDPLATT